MKRIDEYVLDFTHLQGELLYEIYRRSEIVKVIENVKDRKYHNAVVFMKYTAGEEFKPYNLDGEHYFITSVATYGGKFTTHSLNTKHKTTFVVSKDEGNEIYKTISKTKRFDSF